MIRLTNIKIDNGIISATVTSVEVHPVTFDISLDIAEKKIVKNTYDKIDSYVGMAVKKLSDIAKQSKPGDVPEVYEVAWY